MTTEQTPTRQQLVALAREIQKVTARLDEVATLSGEAKETAEAATRAAGRLAEELVDLVRAGELAAGGQADDDGEEDKVPPALSWLTITDPDGAAKLVDGLPQWLGEVYCRWQTVSLPDCWAWHPAVVAELLALREAWQAATNPKTGSTAKQMDWVDRYRPGTARRIERETKDCSLLRHTHDKPTAFRPPRVEGAEMLGELTEWWVNSGGRSAAPAPAAAMLATARARQAEED